MTKDCDYEYGEEIEVKAREELDYITGRFLFQTPSRDVCCVDKMDFIDSKTFVVRTWEYHRKLQKPKEPEYEPYTFETFKADRDCWFRKTGYDDCVSVTAFNDEYLFFAASVNGHSWKEFFEDYTKEDGTPAGVLREGSDE